MRWLLALLIAIGLGAQAAEVPDWFGDSFLDMREDVADAAKERKRVLLYFHQNGCKYCRELTAVTLSEPRTVEEVRRHFVPLPINILGAREVTLPDGGTVMEKAFAALHKVRFTPTIVILDERGEAVHRIHGTLPPEAFRKALEPARLARQN